MTSAAATLATPATAGTRAQKIPMGIKLAYTAFAAVLIPVYLAHYGPTNFLYFCDQAVLLTLAGLWLESPLLISLCAVGILAPQVLWIADFLGQAMGWPLTGMTAYMFDPRKPLLLRALSGFHGWLPLLLVFLVARLGYDRRALPLWSLMALVTLAVCYAFLPGPDPDAGLTPVNINYVHGLSDATAQGFVPPLVWLAGMMLGLPALLFWPTHRLLVRFMPAARPAPGATPRR